MDAIYPCVLGEINRLHTLELVLNKWRDATTILRLQRQLNDIKVEQVTDKLTREFDEYYDSASDYEETIINLAYILQSQGIAFFFNYRWSCLDIDRAHDEDMFLEAHLLAVLAYKTGMLPEEVPVELYLTDLV